MNILQEIDSTLHYEKIEEAWHKYKYAFILALIALFGGVAGFNAYNANVLKTSEHDTNIIFKAMVNQTTVKDATEVFIPALAKLKTQESKNILNLELAKAYKAQNKLEDYEKTLLALTKSSKGTIESVSKYMLAEYYLSVNSEKALKYIESIKISKKASTYLLIQELKAMALANTGKVEEAKNLYTILSTDTKAPEDLKKRVQIKLDQLG